MSNISELIAKLSSMKDNEGSSGGGDRSEGFHPSEGAGNAIANLEILSSGGDDFSMSSKMSGLMDVLSPSISLADIMGIMNKSAGYITFDFIEKFAPIAVRSKLTVLAQKNFLLSSLKPPHLAIGGIKSAFGKGEGKEQ